MAERNDFAALGLDLIAGSGIRLEDTEDGLIIISTSGGGGGSLGSYEGKFDATTVKQRAFDPDDYILFDDGTRQEVFLAPEAIPINSPAPNEAGALWGGFTALITSGISAADLTNRLTSYVLKSALTTMLGDYVLENALTNKLSNYVLKSALTTALNEKADVSALTNYVRTSVLAAALSGKADLSALANFLHTSTFNIEKARLESGITGNDNDIAALNTVVSNLQTTIDTLSTRVENIPVSAEVLWATSKQVAARLPRGTVDTDWTLAETVSAGVAADSDILDIPEGFRGDLHVDLETTTGDLIQRRIIPIHVGNTNFSAPLSNRLRARITQDATDTTKLNFFLDASQAVTMPSNFIVKVYGVTALPRSTVAPVTQAEFDALKAEVDTKLDESEDFYIDITPRHAKFRTSGSDPDALDGNFVFVFSHVPKKYATANLVQVNFQGVRAYRGAWTPSTRYIRFGFESTGLMNLRNNTDRNQATWQIEVTFFNGSTNLGDERSFVVIDRG